MKRQRHQRATTTMHNEREKGNEEQKKGSGKCQDIEEVIGEWSDRWLV